MNDIEGAENFLSASTQATLLFNSFVGGAAIIEYDGVNIEALRLNDSFFEVIGTTREEYSGKQLNVLERIEEESKNDFIAAINEAIETGRESNCEICSKPLTEDGEQIWTRQSMRLIAKNIDRYILYVAIENITQRKKLLMNNIMLTEQLSAIMDSVPGGIVDFEVNNGSIRITYFNDIAATMFGFSRKVYSSLFSKSPLDAVHPDDLEAVCLRVNSILQKNEEVIEMTLRHKCADGGWRWIRLTGHAIRRKGGIVYASGILIDIDSQVKNEQIAEKQAEELERQRVSLQTLYDTIPCGIVQLSAKKENGTLGDLLGFNDTTWKIFGYADREHYLESVRGINKKKSIYPDDIPVIQKNIDDVVESEAGRRVESELRIIREDGSIR